MSNRALTAAFQHSAAKGTARLVILAMADEANDQGLLTAYRRSQSWLAKKANCDKGSVRRAIDALCTLGELAVLAQGDGRESSNYQLLLPDLEPSEGVQDAPPGRAPRRPRGGTTPAQGVQDAPPIIPFGPIPPGEPPADGKPPEPARVLVEAFWQWCKDQGRPTPTLPAGGHGNAYMALVAIVRHLLAAGHPEAAVKRALTTTPVYSLNALTLQINQAKGTSSGPGPRAPVAADRDRPSGRVTDL